jgi:hypothetical protein
VGIWRNVSHEDVNIYRLDVDAVRTREIWKRRETDGTRYRTRTNTNPQSGSTPRRLPRSDRPTLDRVSESSSRMVTCGSTSSGTTKTRTNLTASSSPPSSTLEHELGITRLPSDWVDTLVSVKGRVQLRPVCPRKSCGSGGCEF